MAYQKDSLAVHGKALGDLLDQGPEVAGIIDASVPKIPNGVGGVPERLAPLVSSAVSLKCLS